MPFFELKNSEERELIPGFRGRVVHSDSMTFIYWDVDEGAVLPEHSHPHEQVAHVLEGSFLLVIDGIEQILEPGHVAAIPSNAVHSGRAITSCRLMDAFNPVREDYR